MNFTLVVQALAACDVFIEHVDKMVTFKPVNECILSRYLRCLLQYLSVGEQVSNTVSQPDGLFVLLREKGWVIQPDQQDAYELFCVLLESLQEDWTTSEVSYSERLLWPLTLAEFNAGHVVTTTTPQPWRSRVPLQPPESNIRSNSAHLLFIVTSLKCNKCDYTYPPTLEIHQSLSLALPSPSLSFLTNGVHLGHLLSVALPSALCAQPLQGARCERCGSRSSLCRRASLGRLPRLVCLHLQRVEWHAGGASKRHDKVSFETVDRGVL